MKDSVLCTPEEYIPSIVAYFNGKIDLDPCANVHSKIPALTKYLLPADGLELPWFGNVYVNPPWGYDFDTIGGEIRKWLVKAASEYNNCKQILFYLPYRPNAEWWSLFNEPRIGVCPVKNSASRLWTQDESCGEVVETAFIYLK